jgi:hypothetical protein
MNLRIAVTASANSRRLLEQRMEEAEIVLVGYHVQHTIDALLGLQPWMFPQLAHESGADVVAGPPWKHFVAAALRYPSLISFFSQ